MPPVERSIGVGRTRSKAAQFRPSTQIQDGTVTLEQDRVDGRYRSVCNARNHSDAMIALKFGVVLLMKIR